MPTTISPQELKTRMEAQESSALIDVREPNEYDKGQIYSATSVPRRYLEFRMPHLVPVKSTPLVVCDDDGRRARLAALTLEGMGYSQVAVLDGGLNAWSVAGFQTCRGTNVPSKDFGEKVLVQQQVPETTPEELQARLQRGEKIIILDTRTPEEFRAFTLPGSRSMPGGELPYRIMDIIENNLDTPVLVHCAGRTRSIIGTRILRRMGLRNVYGLRNGTMGWVLAGLELESGKNPGEPGAPSPQSIAASETFASTVAAEDGVRYLSAPELQTLMARTDRETVYLVDVRTSQEYGIKHIPGAHWMPGGQAVQRADDLVAVRNATVVFACDGRARSTLVASWFVQMGFPNIFALDGGTAAWVVAGFPLEEGWPSLLPAGLKEAQAQTRYVAPQALAEVIDSGDASIILDLETSREYKAGHLPGARWLPRGWLELRIASKAPLKQLPLVLTCHDGLTSTLAAPYLTRMGYEQVTVLEGGTAAWRQARLTLATGMGDISEEPRDIIHSMGERTREEMMDYLEWEEDLGHKYEQG